MFADICKSGASPLAGHAVALHGAGALPGRWTYAAAVPTYNPLGCEATFLSADDVSAAIRRVADPPAGGVVA